MDKINKAIKTLRKYCTEYYGARGGCIGCRLKNVGCEMPCGYKENRYGWMEEQNNVLKTLKSQFENIDDCNNCPFLNNCSEVPKYWREL